MFACVHLSPSGRPSDRPGLPLLSEPTGELAGQQRVRAQDLLPSASLTSLFLCQPYVHYECMNVHMNSNYMFCLWSNKKCKILCKRGFHFCRPLSVFEEKIKDNNLQMHIERN